MTELEILKQKHLKLVEEFDNLDPADAKSQSQQLIKELSRIGERISEANTRNLIVSLMLYWSDRIYNKFGVNYKIPLEPFNEEERIVRSNIPSESSLFPNVRLDETKMVSDWLVSGIKLVGIFGLGGMGKTLLSKEIAKLNSHLFDFIFWFDANSSSGIRLFLESIIDFLKIGTNIDLSEDLTFKGQEILQFVSKNKCLIIIDNLEYIEEKEIRIHKKEDHQNYSYYQFFNDFCNQENLSNIVITSEIYSDCFTKFELKQLPVKWITLQPINVNASVKLFQELGIRIPGNQIEKMVEMFGGNPLALALFSHFYGNYSKLNGIELQEFGDSVFESPILENLIKESLNTLNDKQRTLLFWMAKNDNPVNFFQLKNAVNKVHPDWNVIFNLDFLIKNHFIVERDGNLSIYSILKNYLIKYFLVEMVQEIGREKTTNNPGNDFLILQSVPLLNPDEVENHQTSDQRILLKKVCKKLIDKYGESKAKKLSRNVIETIKAEYSSLPGFVVGNVINILCYLEDGLNNIDLSRLYIWNVNFQGYKLNNINLSNAKLNNVLFSEKFSNILSLGYDNEHRFLIAGDSEGKIRVWNEEIQKFQNVFEAHSGWVNAIIVLPEKHQIITGGGDKKIRKWNYLTGDLILEFPEGHSQWIETLDYCNKNSLLASGSGDSTIKIWDANNGDCIHSLEGHSSRVNAVVFNKQGSVLASSDADGKIIIWEVKSFSKMREFIAHEDGVKSLIFSLDQDLLISGSMNGIINIWDFKSENPESIGVLEGHDGRINSFDISKESNFLASAASDNKIIIWNIKNFSKYSELIGHKNWVNSIKFNWNNNQLFSCSEDSSIRIWNLHDSGLIRVISSYSNEIRDVDFQKYTSRLISGGEDHNIYLWDVNLGKSVNVLSGHQNRVWCVKSSPDGSLIASGGHDHLIKLWRSDNGELLTTYKGHQGKIRAVSFNEKQTILASTGDDAMIKLWSIPEGECMTIKDAHEGRIRDILFINDHEVVSCGDDKRLKIWDINTLNFRQPPNMFHKGWIRTLAINKEGTLLASAGDDKVVYLWDPNSLKCIRTLEGHKGRIWDIEFFTNHETTWLISSSGNGDNTIRVWDLKTYECVKVLSGHKEQIQSISINDKLHLLASSGEDEQIIIWDLENLSELMRISVDPLYKDVNIYQVKGITDLQHSSLKALGAVEIP